MLNIQKISKSYKNKPILEDISLHIEESAGVYGLLGRNGAGKTTLMKIIFDMIPNYLGKITLHGEAIPETPDQLANILYVGGEINKYNLLFQGKINHLMKAYAQMYPSFDSDFAHRMLERFEIDPKQKFSKLSTGNKTLVQNIIGLASYCPLTILDEPTNGLDSVNRQLFFQFLMESFEAHPRVFILSTHLIQEVEHYLTHVVMLKDHHIILNDTIEGIQEKSHRIINGPQLSHPVIHQDQLGMMTIQDIYGDLSAQELQNIKDHGGNIEPLGLQDLFNGLMLHNQTLTLQSNNTH